MLDDTAGAVVLISAGVGFTPVLAMLHAAIDPVRNGGQRRVWWIHAARDGAHHPFADEVRRLAAMKAVTSRVVYSRPRPEDREGVDYDRTGYVDQGLLRELDLPATATYYLCGPGPFMDAMTAALTALGVGPGRVLREAFGGGSSKAGVKLGPAHLPSGRQGDGPQVTFLRSGLTTRWSDRYASLLELAEACEAPVRWVCRAGVCHQCETGLVEGEVNYAHDPLDLPSQGAVLICCARPASDIVLDI